MVGAPRPRHIPSSSSGTVPRRLISSNERLPANAQERSIVHPFSPALVHFHLPMESHTDTTDERIGISSDWTGPPSSAAIFWNLLSYLSQVTLNGAGDNRTGPWDQ